MLYVNTIVISLRVVEIIENIIDTILNFYLYDLIFSLLHKSLNLKRQKMSPSIDKFRSVVT